MSVVTKFNMTKDISGFNGFGLQTSNTIKGVLLAQNVAQSAVAPTDAAYYIAVFSYVGGAVFVNSKGTATAYSGTIGAVTSELNPSAREVKAGTTISMLTPDSAGAYVEVAFYVAPPFIN